MTDPSSSNATSSSSSSSSEVFKGTIKWFSNKKGYGFITPMEGQTVTDDVFVHQSTIHAKGFRRLMAGIGVEFKIETDADGKRTAKDVSGKDGTELVVRKKKQGHTNQTNDEALPTDAKKKNEASKEKSSKNKEKSDEGEKTKTSKSEFWHSNVNEDVSSALSEKGISVATGTIDISLGDHRIKLGSQGYCSCAHKDKKLVEGTFTSSNDGSVTFTWEKCIGFDDESWKLLDAAGIISDLNLKDADVKAVGSSENAETLWGGMLPDPIEILKENEFKMRRVVLTSKTRPSKPRSKGRRPTNGRKGKPRAT